MGDTDVFVLEFTRSPEAFREILMNDGVLSGIANELSNACPVARNGLGHPYVFVQPQKYHQMVRFLTDVGVCCATRNRVWDSMPPRFVIVDAEHGSWVESLVASLPRHHHCYLRRKVLLSLGMLGMAHSHFELQDYLANPSHECVAGHLLAWA